MRQNITDEAVSPVISAILMVACVVILGAVIGTYVFGVVGSSQSSKVVAITANKGTTGIVFTVQGGADLPSVTSLDCIQGNTITQCPNTSLKVGSTCSVSTAGSGIPVMVATFRDGTKQVIWQDSVASSGGSGTAGASSAAIAVTTTAAFSEDVTATSSEVRPYTPEAGGAMADVSVSGPGVASLVSLKTYSSTGTLWTTQATVAPDTLYTMMVGTRSGWTGTTLTGTFTNGDEVILYTW